MAIQTAWEFNWAINLRLNGSKPHKIVTIDRPAWSARYLRVLRAHLERKDSAKPDRGRRLGGAALAGGLVTRDLAVMHEHAIIALGSTYDFANRRNGFTKRADLFLTQTLSPLEAALRATREANVHLRLRSQMLRQHALVLARGNRRLEREIARRQAGELTIRRAKEQYQVLFLESQVMQKKLRQLTRQIIWAQEEERKEISRELHGEVVQTLVGINVELSALGKVTSLGQASLKARVARTQRLVRNSVSAVLRFARELRPAALDDLGLIPALHAYAKGLALKKKIKIQLIAFAGVEALGNAKRTVLYRVAQEALTNVGRHAEATLIRLSIVNVPGSIRMEVVDNGKSFPVEKILLAKDRTRLGLIGMKERIEMVGGNLEIKSVPGKGTTVRAEIPFNPGETKK